MKTRLTLVLALAAVPAFGQALCNRSGLTLTTTPPRLGDPYAITLSGSPNVPGVLGFDLAPGPVTTPFGTVCLGLSLRSKTPDHDGRLRRIHDVGIPPNPALSGLGCSSRLLSPIRSSLRASR